MDLNVRMERDHQILISRTVERWCFSITSAIQKMQTSVRSDSIAYYVTAGQNTIVEHAENCKIIL